MSGKNPKFQDAVALVKEYWGDGVFPSQASVDGFMGILVACSYLFKCSTGDVLNGAGANIASLKIDVTKAKKTVSFLN